MSRARFYATPTVCLGFLAFASPAWGLDPTADAHWLTLKVSTPYTSCRNQALYQAFEQKPAGSNGMLWFLPSATGPCPGDPLLVLPTGLAITAHKDLADWKAWGDLSLACGATYQNYLSKNAVVLEKMRACAAGWSDFRADAIPDPACAKYYALFRNEILPANSRSRRKMAAAAQTDVLLTSGFVGLKAKASQSLEVPRHWPELPVAKKPLESDEIDTLLSELEDYLGAARDDYVERLSVAHLPGGSLQDGIGAGLGRTHADLETLRSLKKSQLVPPPALHGWKTELGVQLHAVSRQLDAMARLEFRRYPILLLLSSAHPEPKEIARALEAMLGNIRQQEEWATARMESVHSEKPDSLQAMFDLTSMPLLTDEILGANPRLCAPATALAFHSENKSIRKLMFVEAPAALAAALGAEPVAIPLALAGDWYWISDQQKDILRQQQASLTNAVGFKPDPKSMAEIPFVKTSTEEAFDGEENLHQLWLMTPLSVVGIPGLARPLTKGGLKAAPK